MAKGAYDVMDLKALRCFWAMSKHGSLTRAGIELGIAQAAVSQRVKSLEKYLGAKLYEARGGKVRLTPAGHHTMEMAIRLFERVEDFETAVATEDALATITVCTHDGILRYLLPGIVKQFSREFPLTRLRLITRTFAATVKLLRANEVDLGIIAQHRVPDDLRFVPLATYEAYVLIPRGHPLVRRGEPAMNDLLTVDILKRYPLVMHADDADHHDVRRVLQREGLPFNVGMEVGTIEALKYYVSEGHGLGILSGLCVTEEDKRELHAIKIPADLWAGTTYGVLHRQDKHVTPPLGGLLKLLGVNLRSTAD